MRKECWSITDPLLRENCIKSVDMYEPLVASPARCLFDEVQSSPNPLRKLLDGAATYQTHSRR